jgi:hypothetical protein
MYFVIKLFLVLGKYFLLESQPLYCRIVMFLWPLSSGYQGTQGMKLITDLHLVLKLRKHDTPHSLMQIIAWYLKSCAKNSFTTHRTTLPLLFYMFLTYLLRGLSPQANYTDRATAACRRSYCQLLRIEGATWSAWHPYGHVLGFLGRTCCVNPIDNTHYAPIITTTPSTRTKYSHKILH